MSLINREALLSILEEQQRLWREQRTYPSEASVYHAGADAVAKVIDFVQHMPAVAVTREDIPVAALAAAVREALALADGVRARATQAHRRLANVLEVLGGGG